MQHSITSYLLLYGFELCIGVLAFCMLAWRAPCPTLNPILTPCCLLPSPANFMQSTRRPASCAHLAHTRRRSSRRPACPAPLAPLPTPGDLATARPASRGPMRPQVTTAIWRPEGRMVAAREEHNPEEGASGVLNLQCC